MQYALMEVKEDVLCLIDANELKYLNQDGRVIDELSADENALSLKLIYGCYLQQRDRGYSEQDIEEQVNYAVDKWLIHLSNFTAIYLGIEDIEIINKTEEKFTFAALASVPKEFTVNQRGQARTVFLRWHDMDILTNLLNREGLFAFGAEEKRISDNVQLTKENWKQYIDFRRARRCASSIW